LNAQFVKRLEVSSLEGGRSGECLENRERRLNLPVGGDRQRARRIVHTSPENLAVFLKIAADNNDGEHQQRGDGNEYERDQMPTDGEWSTCDACQHARIVSPTPSA
jgi:hypothetical protein